NHRTKVGSDSTWRVDRLRHRALPLLLAVDEDDRLVFVSLHARPGPLFAFAQRHGATLVVERRAKTRARTQMREYLHGRRTAFELPFALLGTEFEQHVWRTLASIPYGETRAYAELASSIGSPNSARAVGRANGRNPLPLLLPCHRVIGATGALVGFGGGLPTKRWLLQLEREHQPPPWRPGERGDAPLQLGLFG
ncbi:MAG: methylated-DNA--[protein]-cysteine S-methyltransferase, partial [Nannocystaceae bacterium]